MPILNPEKTLKILADRLKALRIRQNFQQEEISIRSGVPIATLRRLENSGKGTLLTFLKVSMALGRLQEFSNLLEVPVAKSIDELEKLSAKKSQKRVRK